MKTKFLFLGVPPPSNLFVPPGQALSVQFYNLCVQVNIHVITRILRPDGEIREIDSPFVVPQGPNPMVRIIPLTECYILSCTVRSYSANLLPSHLYVIVNLVNSVTAAATVIQQLIGGYVSGQSCQSYPSSQIKLSTDVQPLIALYQAVDPGLGAPVFYPAPAFLHHRIVSMQFDFTTAAGGAVRRVFIELIRGGTICQRVDSSTTQAAGLTVSYVFHALKTPALVGSLTEEVLPHDFSIVLGDTLSINAAALGVGDEFVDIYMAVEERLLI
jgi:hypothetical protein